MKNVTVNDMMNRTIHCNMIFTTLFLNGKIATSKQFADSLNTSMSSVRSRISELRNLGLTIRCVADGGHNFHYVAGAPTRAEVAYARTVHVEGFYNPAPIPANTIC